jgi:CDP-glucose 4,6-dehydratase
MEKNYKKIFKNKKILITGHTGFKGSWLTSWMLKLGANITGVSNDIPTKESHYRYLKIDKKIKNFKIDIRDFTKFKNIVLKTKPDFIFHLAAQALVKESYEKPFLTFQTNSIGTLNLLEILRYFKKKCTVVIITSDKVYKNIESKRGYKENGILGGVDPYSASKATAEIIINSYLKSFFFKKNNQVSVAVARAGNVIGGGDWAKNRLIPDCMKAWSKKKTVLLRNPKSTRPWQHVLEAIWGYINLASNLRHNKRIHGQAFNFGPNQKSNHNVIKIVNLIKKNWKNIKWKIQKNKNKIKETNILKLDSTKSLKTLNWKCALTINETMTMVSAWYNNYYFNRSKKVNFTYKQIEEYEKVLKKRLLK